MNEPAAVSILWVLASATVMVGVYATAFEAARRWTARSAGGGGE